MRRRKPAAFCADNLAVNRQVIAAVHEAVRLTRDYITPGSSGVLRLRGTRRGYPNQRLCGSDQRI